MAEQMQVEDIMEYMINTYRDDLIVGHNWGERGIFFNPGRKLPKGVYVLTFKERDGPNDCASNVNRTGVYRLNLGISKSAFVNLFGEIPARPPAGSVVTTGHDFTQLDQIMPHPVYGWMTWLGVLSPSQSTFETLKPLIVEAVLLAERKYNKRLAKL